MPRYNIRKINFVSTGAIFVYIALIAYCISHSFIGQYSYTQRIQFEVEAKRLTAELNTYQKERNILERLTLRLSDDYLDIDLLDERARKVLGLARIDEVIIH